MRTGILSDASIAQMCIAERPIPMNAVTSMFNIAQLQEMNANNSIIMGVRPLKYNQPPARPVTFIGMANNIVNLSQSVDKSQEIAQMINGYTQQLMTTEEEFELRRIEIDSLDSRASDLLAELHSTYSSSPSLTEMSSSGEFPDGETPARRNLEMFNQHVLDKEQSEEAEMAQSLARRNITPNFANYLMDNGEDPTEISDAKLVRHRANFNETPPPPVASSSASGSGSNYASMLTGRGDKVLPYKTKTPKADGILPALNRFVGHLSSKQVRATRSTTNKIQPAPPGEIKLPIEERKNLDEELYLLQEKMKEMEKQNKNSPYSLFPK